MNDPVRVDRRADDFAARFLFDRNRLAGDHRFVDRAASFENDSIDRNFFSGTDAQAVAGLHLLERNVFFGAIIARSGGQSSELRSSSARMAALVRLRARSSITWPSRTSVVMAAAASK